MGERIVLPALNVTVEVVGIKPGAVSLGITAPPEITILRAEVPDRATQRSGTQPQAGAHLQDLLRGRLQITRTGLAELRRQLREGRLETAQLLLDNIEEDVGLLQERLDGAPRDEARTAPRPRRRALLVDDDRNICVLLSECLRRSGIDVDTAGDGVAALDYLRTHRRPDVLLLDMVLPRCDGPTTLRAIRRDPRYAGLPIYGLSGHAREEFDLDPGPAGINGWYQKPVDPQALLRDLSRALDAPVNRLPPATASRIAPGTQATRK
jgi:CheY-like chemotaxis protein/sRNA-binding carbon storage regulator CsrA